MEKYHYPQILEGYYVSPMTKTLKIFNLSYYFPSLVTILDSKC